MTVDRIVYRAHRLIWLMYHGQWPPQEIDHINGDRADNRIVNLRLATASQNRANSKVYKTNRCGFKGVARTPYGRWVARIHFEKTKYLGTFDTPEEAHAAYVRAAQAAHGIFARSGAATSGPSVER